MRAGFAEAEDTTPQLDHRLQHRRAAAPPAFDCHVRLRLSFDPFYIRGMYEHIKNKNNVTGAMMARLARAGVPHRFGQGRCSRQGPLHRCKKGVGG